MTDEPYYITHHKPIWRSRADFAIAASLEEDGIEQLPCRQLSEYEFEVCCLPFFLYGVGLGDVVATDTELLMTGVVRPAGRHLFRFSPKSRWSRGKWRRVHGQLEELGALIEHAEGGLMAIDAGDTRTAENVTAYLRDLEAKRWGVWESAH